MKNNKKPRYKSPVNKYDTGGTILDNINAAKAGGAGSAAAGQAALGQGLGVATGALGLITSGIGHLKTDVYKTADFSNAGSLDSLQSQAGAYIPEKARTENAGGAAVSGALQGAQAGMAFGPWGAAVGGVVGGATGLITTLFGNKKKKKAANTAEEKSILNMGQAAQNIGQMNALNEQSQYFAKGGDLLFVAPEDVKYLAAGGALMSREPLSNKDTGLFNTINQFANGGQTGNGVTTFNNGGTHEENPLGGIPQGIGANGLPNLVEEGEVKYKDYIFSDRLRAKQSTLAEVGLPNKYIGKTYGDIAKNLQKESAERPNDPISQKGLADMMQRLKTAQESTRAQKMQRMQSSQQPSQEEMMQMMTQQQEQTQPQEMAYGGNIFAVPGDKSNGNQMSFLDLNNAAMGNLGAPFVQFNSTEPEVVQTPTITDTKILQGINPNQADKIAKRNAIAKQEGIVVNPKSTPNIFSNIDSSYLRYAPILASGLQAFSDQAGWTNKADSTLADTVSNQGVKATRLTDRMTYQPLDTRWLQNQANAQQAATRQAIIDQSGGNRATAMAGLIGANYSGNLQAGQLARQEAEYNQAQRQKVFEFNRATNQYNADADRWEQSTNMQNKIQGAQLKEQTIQQAAAVRNANMNNFLNNITGLGQEAMTRNMITSNPALYYTIDSSGKVQYKQSDVAKYAKENNMTLAQAEEVIKNHAATNPNYKK